MSRRQTCPSHDTFNRLFQASGCERLRAAAEAWLESLMHAWQPSGVGADAGLLTGSAGIGLTLLAAATPLEPHWDRVLLLS